MARERTVVEDESANTLENVLFALPAIDRRVDIGSIESVVVVTKWYHCRRAMMTLKRHLPAAIRYYAVTYEPRGMERSDWWQSEVGRGRVLKERECISKYLAAGDIGEIREENGAFV